MQAVNLPPIRREGHSDWGSAGQLDHEGTVLQDGALTAHRQRIAIHVAVVDAVPGQQAIGGFSVVEDVMVGALLEADAIGFQISGGIGGNPEIAMRVPVAPAIGVIDPQAERAVAEVFDQNGPQHLALRHGRGGRCDGGQGKGCKGKQFDLHRTSPGKAHRAVQA